MPWADGGAWGSGAGSNKTSGGTTLNITTGDTAAIGDIIIVAVATDNLTTTTPTVSSINKMAGESNNWVQLAHVDSDQSSGASGVILEIWGIQASIAWTSTVLTITLSGGVTAKAAVGRLFTGGSLTVRGSAAVDNDTGGTSTQATATLSGASQPQTGDLILEAIGWERDVAPTQSDGTMTLAQNVATSGGGAAANMGVALYWKVAASNANFTGTSDNVTASSDIALVALQPAAAPPSGFTGWGVPIS